MEMTRREMIIRACGATALSLRPYGLLRGEGADGSIKRDWPVQSLHLFHGALRPGIGFSFRYNGRNIGPGIPIEWRISTEEKGETTQTSFRHPSGLVVVREARSFPDFEAFEYTVRFRNESRSSLPALGPINALDLSFGEDVLHGLSLVSSGGGAADPVFPPKDFALARTFFAPMVPLNAQFWLTAEEGNSSRINLPFFFVENQDKSAGIYVGIGWTGNWRASIQADYNKNHLRLQGGVPDINLQLEPGEEISSPAILVGAYRGPLSAGSNRLRRLIRDRYAPTIDGHIVEPPVLYTTWFDVGAELDEELFKTLADHAADIGQEIFLLDAGWYKGTATKPYTDMGATWDAISNPLGNWEQGEARTRFPSGLKVLADYVRSRGMQFGLWFEPERVGPESVLAKTHADWIIWIPQRKWGLLYFGRPEVQEYFCKILDQYIKELGLRYVRWDQNNNLMPYWDAHDRPDRRGISQIRHLEGIHRVEDWLREHYPDVILESCAGGGQRIDLPTLKRRHTIWISDQTMDPHIVRFHLEGLNHFLPGNYQMVAFAPPTVTYQKPGFVFPDIAHQSYFAGAFGLAGRLHEWPPVMKDQARKHFGIYKKVRRFLSEDFYLLRPQPRDLQQWEAWQFHEPNAEEGFVQVFRLHATSPSEDIVLKALNPASSYRFWDAYLGDSFELAGAKALTEGIRFEIPPMSSRILFYQRVH